MLEPNLYTLTENGVNYALHRFKDGEVVLCCQHKCGDWQTMRRPTGVEVSVFEKHGVPIGRIGKGKVA